MPSIRPTEMSFLSEEQMNTELDKGYTDMREGKTKSASKVFVDIRKNYNV